MSVLTEALLYHGDGDQCIGSECLSIDEATGYHDTDLHSDDWWEGFTEAGRRILGAQTSLHDCDWMVVVGVVERPDGSRSAGLYVCDHGHQMHWAEQPAPEPS